MQRLLFLPLAALAVALLAGPGRSADKDALAADELKLKGAFIPTDGAGLVHFLRTRARGEVAKDRLDELLKDLGSEDAPKRQKATAELVSIGSPAVPSLRLAARDIDAPELSASARACLRAIEEEPGAITVSVVRLLADRKPEGVAVALLEYLPHSESDAVQEEIKNVLISVAYEKGKPNPVLLKALSDKTPLRRATAIAALCASGIPEPRALFRRLLSDPKPSVRLRASLALAGASDPKAVSTLITLLPELPLEQAKEIETFLTELAGELAPKVALAEDALGREKTRDAWARWWLDTEGPSLLNELARRTLSEEELAKISTLIEKLGDDMFDVRRDAETALKKMGTKIIPLLKAARTNADLEIRNRSQKTLEALESDKDRLPPLSPVTARLIALRKPRGGAEAILAYLPFCDDESLLDELQTALNAVAYRDGKAQPAVLKAITDRHPARRSAAGQALCAGPLAPYMPEIRKALADKDPEVRARTALALAAAKEPEAVPILIKVVAEANGESAIAAEEYLAKLARDAGPKDLPDGDENRKRRSAAWAKWWDENKGKVAMVDRYSPAARVPYMGYTLLVEASNNQLRELDKNNKVRWAINSLNNPWDARVLPGNKVLIAEYNGQKVSERSTNGKVIWEKHIGTWPTGVERLRNGRTWVTCRNACIELDKSHKEVFRLSRPASDIYSARRLPSGQIVVVTTSQMCIRYDRTGKKELKSFRMHNVMYHQNEILDNGHVLVPMGWMNKVVEFDANGKEVWSCNTVMQPSHASRLANGNTVISSQNWPNRVTEVDKKGKKLNEYTTNTYVFRAHRR